MATVKLVSATVVGEQVTVTGTVDGAEVTVTVWKSHLVTLTTKAAKVAYVAAQMKAQAPAAPTAMDLAATVTI